MYFILISSESSIRRLFVPPCTVTVSSFLFTLPIFPALLYFGPSSFCCSLPLLDHHPSSDCWLCPKRWDASLPGPSSSSQPLSFSPLPQSILLSSPLVLQRSTPVHTFWTCRVTRQFGTLHATARAWEKDCSSSLTLLFARLFTDHMINTCLVPAVAHVHQPLLCFIQYHCFSPFGTQDAFSLI